MSAEVIHSTIFVDIDRVMQVWEDKAGQLFLLYELYNHDGRTLFLVHV